MVVPTPTTPRPERSHRDTPLCGCRPPRRQRAGESRAGGTRPDRPPPPARRRPSRHDGHRRPRPAGRGERGPRPAGRCARAHRARRPGRRRPRAGRAGPRCPGGGPREGPPMILDVVSAALVVAGCFFFTAGTVGLLRFRDLHTKLHALTKADNLGLGLVVLGLVLQADSPATALKLV